ncbi:hypothetical protein KX816_12325 [Sphingosinicellaceae bacterium]|nr:hypothetical protein KX816_12325 [Sphingosinicellaceae bacterium]
MPEAIVAKHLDGIGDLIVAAPVKRDFIDAFETVTYETRQKRRRSTIVDVPALVRLVHLASGDATLDA